MDDDPTNNPTSPYYFLNYQTAPNQTPLRSHHDDQYNVMVADCTRLYSQDNAPSSSSLLSGDGMLTRSTTTTAAAAAAASDDVDNNSDNYVSADDEVYNSDKEDILSSHHKNATPFQKPKTVFNDQNVEMIVRRTYFAKQKRFNMDDHQFQVTVKIRNEEDDKPLLESMLDALGSALHDILVQMRAFYTEHDRFIYVVR